MNYSSPFFIIANPRSGSSLLRIICDSHPSLTVPPECGFLEWWSEKYKDWCLKDNFSDRLEFFCKDLASSKKFSTWSFDFKVLKSLIANEMPEDYSSLISLVYIAYGLNRKSEIKVWGDKNNYYIHKLNKINTLYPNARFLYLTRDGRDVANSYIKLQELKTESRYKPILPKNIEDIAEEWDYNNRKIISFLSNIPIDRYLTIKFENLITNLEVQCQNICSFLNIPFQEEMLEYYIQNRKFSLEPKETLDWKLNTLEKPDLSRIGNYKDELSQENINNFNSIAGQTLERLGYVK